jgi:acetyl-CoA C-acetyltransferase
MTIARNPGSPTDIVLAAGARTPIGRLVGSLGSVPAVELGAAAVRATLDRAGGLVPDRVVMGCVLQAGLGQDPARQAALRGGAAATTPGMTINDVCLSGMSAAIIGGVLVRAGHAASVLVGGFESMSRAAHAATLRAGLRLGDATLVDTMIRDGLWCAFEDVAMGPQAEAMTAALGIGRADQDAFAAASHRRADEAWRTGRLANEVVAVAAGRSTVETDEGIRSDTSEEALARLPAAFSQTGTITAGNASQISDAGAAGIITTRERAEAAGVEPLAVLVDHELLAGPDHSLHTKPSRAARVLLTRQGMAPRDIDRWEINEAFAAVVLASMSDLDIDHAVVNVNGGAIALGHPLGASGFRLLLTLALEMRRSGATTGVAAICGGGGQGQAVLLRHP